MEEPLKEKEMLEYGKRREVCTCIDVVYARKSTYRLSNREEGS